MTKTTKLGCRVVVYEDETMTTRCGDLSDADREAGCMPFLCRACFAAAKPWHADGCAVGHGGDCTCGAQAVIDEVL